ncbi:MAG: S8/S53 family peptidase [Armatimonadota bacterium]|nr:S8/S53 family peptidase [Armatimonadota bacterium]
MHGGWNRLRGHLVVACPEALLDSLEQSHSVRCLLPPPRPQTVFVSRRPGGAWRWEALPLPPVRRSPPWFRAVRRFVVETDEPERNVARRLSEAAPSAHASLDFQVRGQAEVAHGSPTPESAICVPDADEVDFASQPAFEQIGLLQYERVKFRPRGEGVTVVILDSGPGLGPDGLPRLDPGCVDVYVDWPQRVPENFPLWVPLTDAEDPPCGLAERWRATAWSPLLATDAQMQDYRAHHGAMVASLVRRVAPGARVVLVALLNRELATATYELAEVLRWAYELASLPVRHPDTRAPLVTLPLAYNLSLGVDRSQPETVQSCALLAVVDELARQRAVLVAASGNLSQGRPENCLEPAAYGHFGDTLATQTQVIPVAATSAAQPDRYAWFSNEAHFAAPGEDLILDCGAVLAGSRYVRWSGTSFAAGLVTGVVAVLLSTGLSPEMVKARLWERAARPSRWDGVHAVRL